MYITFGIIHHRYRIVLVWTRAAPINCTRAYELLLQAILAPSLNIPPLTTDRFETLERKVRHHWSVVYEWLRETHQPCGFWVRLTL